MNAHMETNDAYAVARAGLLAVAAISSATAAIAAAMGRKGWIDGFQADTSAALFIGFAMASALAAVTLSR